MSGYMWNAEDLAWLRAVCQALEHVPDNTSNLYLRVEVVSHDDVVGHFTDELGSWAYVDEPR